MTATPAATPTPAPAPAPAVAQPSTDDMLAAIKAVKLAQAQKIGAMCVANTKGTALPLSDLAVDTGILAGLDLAAETLKAGL